MPQSRRCPQYHDHGDILQWLMLDNVPGRYPYTGWHFCLQARERRPHAHVRR
jgi:methylmalonyl-CoA mutase